MCSYPAKSQRYISEVPLDMLLYESVSLLCSTFCWLRIEHQALRPNFAVVININATAGMISGVATCKAGATAVEIELITNVFVVAALASIFFRSSI